MTFGSLLFWAGFVLAYLGVIFLPMFAVSKSRRMALWALLGSCAIGWLTIFSAAIFFGYGLMWVKSWGAYLLFAGFVYAGWKIIQNPPPKEAQC